MASTATTRNRLNKQGTGDSTGTWGSTLNTQVFDLIDEAMDGLTSVAIAGNVTLSSTNYATDQSRKRVLKLTGSPGATFNVTIPGVEKVYLVHNATNATQNIKTAGGVAAAIGAATIAWIYCDGTDCTATSVSLTQATADSRYANVLIQTQTIAASPVSITFTGLDATTYPKYRLSFRGIQPATSATALFLRVGTGGGPTYQTTLNYTYTSRAQNYTSTFPAATGSAGASALTICSAVGTSSGQVASGFIDLDIGQSGQPFMADWKATYFDSSTRLLYEDGGGAWTSTTPNAIQLLWNGVAFANVGSVSLYGLRNS